MLSLSAATRVFVYSEPCDMRCSFRKLIALAKHAVGEDPLSGHLFLFLNRPQTSVKILMWDRTGFSIWYKRLEQGTFSKPNEREINYRELMCVLEGIERKEICMKKRYLLRRDSACEARI